MFLRPQFHGRPVLPTVRSYRLVMDSSIESLALSARAQLRPQKRRARRGQDFRDTVRAFGDFGQATVELVEGSVPYLVNEYWTAGQRQSHSLHEISYRACFKAQLPGFFIEHLTAAGETVYDPFMGRGTTLVEAALRGRRPVGNDINPLSKLLARPRLDPPRLEEVASRLEMVDWATRPDQDEPELLVFFSPATIYRIQALRSWLLERAPLEAVPDRVDDWIRMIAINRLTGHSSGFFSVYTLPPNQAVSTAAQRKINEKRGQVPPDRNINRIILKKSKALLSDGVTPPHPDGLLLTGEASQTAAIRTGSVKLVVTSPPFLDIVQYAEDNWLRNWFAGIDASTVKMAHHRTESAWQAMVRAVLEELARVVMPGGHVAFEVGEIRSGKVLLERLVWEAVGDLPFERLFVMLNQQQFTKTANCWGVANNLKGTNTNRIVVLRRH